MATQARLSRRMGRRSAPPAPPRLVSLDTLLNVSRIIGPMSAAATTIAEIKRRQTLGEAVVCYQVGDTFYVGPPLTPDHPPLASVADP